MADLTARNLQVIEQLYDAFDRGDGEAMAACYLPAATFRDPVFGELTGAEIGDMWKFLTGRAPRLDVDLLEHDADEQSGRAHWQARYEFSATGRSVVNDVRARFAFRDGLILEHTDSFSFYGWCRQALGVRGLVIGWSPPGRRLVRRRALADLRRHAKPAG